MNTFIVCKAFITDPTGGYIPALNQGAVLEVQGSIGADSVYVGEGTQVDATILGSGVGK